MSTATGCTIYNKSTCLQVLNQSKNCSSCKYGNDSSIYIAANVDQDANEKIAQLINLGASPTCKLYLIPLMCLHLFPLCGNNATFSRQECFEISTGVCKVEWQNALNIPVIKDKVPNCSSFPATEQALLFPAFDNTSTMTNDTVLVNCNYQFILINGTCQPLCDKLDLFSDKNSYIDYVILFMASISGLLGGSLLMVSVYVWREKM